MRNGKSTCAGSKQKFVILLFCLLAVITVGVTLGIIFGGKSDDNEADLAPANTCIRFILNNGQEDVICGAGDTIPAPERYGYYLYGWYADSEYTTRIEADGCDEILSLAGAQTDGECKLYAKWEKIKEMTGVRIADAFFIYDGKLHNAEVTGLPEGAEVEYLTDSESEAGEYEVLARVTASGYRSITVSGKMEIAKARIDESGIKFEDARVKWDGKAHSVYVVGVPKGVTVTYDKNGQTDIGEYEITAHFDVGNNYENIADRVATLTIFSDEPVKYTITYQPYGGEILNGETDEYTDKDEVVLPTPNRPHYEFMGWYDNANFEGKKIERIDLGSAGDKIYYAKWKGVQYVLRYDLCGGINNADNVNSGDEYVYTVEDGSIVLKDATKRGYRFSGWKDELGQKVCEIDEENSGNYTLTAQWEAVKYAIRYELNGGTNDSLNPSEYTVEDGEIELNGAVRDKYIFDGWYDVETDGRITSIRCADCKEITLYAVWTEARFQLSESGEILSYDSYFGNDVVIPREVYGIKVTGIAEGALAGAESVSIEAEWREINAGAFANCTALRQLELPSTLDRMPEGLLEDCVNLERLTVPYATDRAQSGDEGIYGPLCEIFGKEERAGFYAVSVRKTRYESGEFNATESVDEAYKRYVPDTLREITVLGGEVPGYALYGLAGVTSITLLGNEVKIGTKGIAECTSLQTLAVREATSVSASALSGCVDLKEIYLSDTCDKTVWTSAISRLKNEGIDVVIKSESDQ